MWLQNKVFHTNTYFLWTVCKYLLAQSSPLMFSHIYGQCFSNWANETSPTLGCSIEISRDIYICVCVGQSVGRSVRLSCPKMRRRNYMSQMHACSKSDLGG